jgi:hypothetical protein
MHSFNDFLEAVRRTPLSVLLQDVRWLIPTIQSVHIMALALVFTSAAVVDLRLLGAGDKSQPLSRMSKRFLPWVGWGVLVLLITGLLLMVAEPTRAILNPFFQIKMLLLVIVGWMTWQIARGAERNTGVFAGIEGSAAAKTVAVASIVIWLAIIGFGRWIAYGP